MVRHLRPLRVLQTASRLLETGRLRREPPWYRVVAAIPPTTSLVRPLPVQMHDRPRKRSRGKQPDMYKPQEIVYPEDELRARFFQDHPWELARPRILVENDGRDFSRYDWSRMKQPGKLLDGESVVQRQLWLLENAGLSTEEAYRVARKEFYDLRMQEDIERRIAKEEALAVGAKFGKSYIDIGIELEQKALEDWRKKALEQVNLQRSRLAAALSGDVGEADDGQLGATEGQEEQEGAATVAQSSPASGTPPL